MAPPTPTTFGKTISGIIGLAIGCATTYYFMKDFQLVKFEPAPSDQDKKSKKLKISFREMQPLELKPEVAAARKLEAERLLKIQQKQELEQIIQDPTT